MHLNNRANAELKEGISSEQSKLKSTKEKAWKQDKDTGNDTWHTLKSMCLDRPDGKKGKTEEDELKEDKLKASSRDAQKKLDTFLCDKGREGKNGCDPCRRTFEPSDLALPCRFLRAWRCLPPDLPTPALTLLRPLLRLRLPRPRCRRRRPPFRRNK